MCFPEAPSCTRWAVLVVDPTQGREGSARCEKLLASGAHWGISPCGATFGHQRNLHSLNGTVGIVSRSFSVIIWHQSLATAK